MGWPCGSVSPANPLQLRILFQAALPASGTWGAGKARAKGPPPGRTRAAG